MSRLRGGSLVGRDSGGLSSEGLELWRGTFRFPISEVLAGGHLLYSPYSVLFMRASGPTFGRIDHGQRPSLAGPTAPPVSRTGEMLSMQETISVQVFQFGKTVAHIICRFEKNR